MNAQKFIAAATLFIAASSAFAADAPAVGAAAAPVAASAAVIAANLNLPTVTIIKNAGQSRAEVQAEAIEFVKNYKTAFAVQLDQYKN